MNQPEVVCIVLIVVSLLPLPRNASIHSDIGLIADPRSRLSYVDRQIDSTPSESVWTEEFRNGRIIYSTVRKWKGSKASGTSSACSFCFSRSASSGESVDKHDRFFYVSVTQRQVDALGIFSEEEK